jgi:hypothetical protein
MVVSHKGHYILLLVGTFLFLASLLAELPDGSGGDWNVFRSDANNNAPVGGHDLGKAVILGKHEAIYAKKAAIKVGVYLAFIALVLGHALLWPAVPLTFKPNLREEIPPGEQPESPA